MISSHAAPILSLLIVGTALNGMMNIPYALQLAYGRPKLIVYMNIAAILTLLPPLIWVASIYGAFGGAMIWLALNVGYIVFSVIIIHRRALQSELIPWAIYDFGVPSAAALVAVMFSWLMMPLGMSDLGRIVWIISSYIFSFSVTLSAASEIRGLFLSRWKRIFVG